MILFRNLCSEKILFQTKMFRKSSEKLGLSEKTVTKAFKQLSDVDLIEEKKQGLEKPNLIYVAKLQYEEKDKISNVSNE